MGKRIVVCADDFAQSEAVSRGIARLARAGRISATSVLSLAPRWPADVEMLRELRGRIDVGLHLDWTSGFAITAGHGMALGAAMLRAALGGFDAARARAVIERQLDAFEAVWQSAPDHIDGHQHVQQFAGIRDALVPLIARRYGANKPYLRVSRAPVGSGLKERVISAMGAYALARDAHAAGIATSSALTGVYDFSGGTARYAALMDGWLAAAPEGAILMCHPAEGSEPDDGIAAAREAEFTYLGSDAFPRALSQARVTVARGVALKVA